MRRHSSPRWPSRRQSKRLADQGERAGNDHQNVHPHESRLPSALPVARGNSRNYPLPIQYWEEFPFSCILQILLKPHATPYPHDIGYRKFPRFSTRSNIRLCGYHSSSCSPSYGTMRNWNSNSCPVDSNGPNHLHLDARLQRR